MHNETFKYDPDFDAGGTFLYLLSDERGEYGGTVFTNVFKYQLNNIDLAWVNPLNAGPHNMRAWEKSRCQVRDGSGQSLGTWTCFRFPGGRASLAEHIPELGARHAVADAASFYPK